MWYLCSLEHAGVIQKLTILECKNGLVLSNTCVPVSGTWSIPFPSIFILIFVFHRFMFSPLRILPVHNANDCVQSMTTVAKVCCIHHSWILSKFSLVIPCWDLFRKCPKISDKSSCTVDSYKTNLLDIGDFIHWKVNFSSKLIFYLEIREAILHFPSTLSEWRTENF